MKTTKITLFVNPCAESPIPCRKRGWGGEGERGREGGGEGRKRGGGGERKKKREGEREKERILSKTMFILVIQVHLHLLICINDSIQVFHLQRTLIEREM